MVHLRQHVEKNALVFYWYIFNFLYTCFMPEPLYQIPGHTSILYGLYICITSFHETSHKIAINFYLSSNKSSCFLSKKKYKNAHFFLKNSHLIQESFQFLILINAFTNIKNVRILQGYIVMLSQTFRIIKYVFTSFHFYLTPVICSR